MCINMINKLSLFLLSEATLKAKLLKANITQAKLNKGIRIYFYINKLDPTDYYITEIEVSNTGYFLDYVDMNEFNECVKIDDIVYYILHNLKECYETLTLKSSQYAFQIMKNEILQMLESDNNILKIRNEVLGNYNQSLLDENKVLKTKNSILEQENKSINIELPRVKAILSNIQSIAI